MWPDEFEEMGPMGFDFDPSVSMVPDAFEKLAILNQYLVGTSQRPLSDADTTP
jgi:hypothetical protein